MSGMLSRFGWALLLALAAMTAAGTRSCVSTAHAEPATVVRGVGCIGLTISDVQRSAEFYARVLGFEKTADVEQAGESIEQLEGVFGARLRITTLRGGFGPGIELLEYLAPTDGRHFPADERSNDLVHWQTTLYAADLAAAASALRVGRAALVSPGLVSLSDARLGYSRALLARDPDGHVMQLASE